MPKNTKEISNQQDIESNSQVFSSPNGIWRCYGKKLDISLAMHIQMLANAFVLLFFRRKKKKKNFPLLFKA